MSRGIEATIDLAAWRHNLRRVRELAPQARVSAAIKANAYGHGLVRAAHAMVESDSFAVACIEEAQVLRQAGITHPIVLLEGAFSAEELPECVRLGLEVVVHHPWQISMLEQARLDAPLVTWLKLDTGMHRIGIQPAELEGALKRLRQCAHVAQPVHFMTHLACADEPAHPLTENQLRCFDGTLDALPGERSIANSAGIVAWPASHRDWVRPGIMLYGVSPLVGGRGAQHDLRPVMTLRSHLIAINHYRVGDTIGYGAEWRCPEDMPVGVVAAGYGDGYPRHARPGTPVWVNGHRVPLVGRVSMDMLSVDLRSHPGARIGDPVVLWGDGLAVEEVAEHAGTIAYELLCCVTNRVRFRELPA